MAISETRWKSIIPSTCSWGQDAVHHSREGLPDRDPYRVWSNFEFIADDGTINEVDPLVLTGSAFFLAEIKNWPGRLKGDVMT